MDNYWTDEQFQTFEIDGLQQRMHALQQRIQPTFRELGEHFSSFFSSYGNDEFHFHVAKHARRTVNPPTDSWVAFAPSKRGYKALPHFQIGMWESHLFLILAIIYENPNKPAIGEQLQRTDALLSLPSTFRLSGDHTKADMPFIQELGKEGVDRVLERLQTVKRAELTVGIQIPREEAIQLSKEQFYAIAERAFQALQPIYYVATNRTY